MSPCAIILRLLPILGLLALWSASPLATSAELVVRNQQFDLEFLPTDFDYEIKDGLSIPRHTEGFVETRIWGRAEVSIDFTNFSRQEAEAALLLASPAGQQ